MRLILSVTTAFVLFFPNLAMSLHSYGPPLPSVDANTLFSYLLLKLGIGSYALAFALQTAALFRTEKILTKLGKKFTLLAISLHVASYLFRWKELYEHGWGRFPLSDFYEALTLFSLMLAATCCFLQIKSQREVVAAFSLPIVIGALLFANGTQFAGISALYTSDYNIELSIFIYRLGVVKLLLLTAGYCLLTTAGVAASMLVASKILSSKSLPVTFFPPAQSLYEWNKIAIISGSVLFTLGFMISLYWSEIAWGTYWAWDSNETILALTFIIYTIIIMKNTRQGWSSSKATSRSIIGLCIIIVTYYIAQHLLRGI